MKQKVQLISAAAGFPSPAENYIEEQLNLNKYLIKNKESSFFVRVSGDSMMNVGIFDNDIFLLETLCIISWSSPIIRHFIEEVPKSIPKYI